MKNKSIDRRRFVKVAAGALATIPLVAIPLTGSAQAESDKLAEDNPSALALGYKEKSSEVDSEKHLNHNDQQLCSGCALYTGDAGAWGGCAIFPGKQVAADGWCAAYAAKPS